MPSQYSAMQDDVKQYSKVFTALSKALLQNNDNPFSVYFGMVQECNKSEGDKLVETLRCIASKESSRNIETKIVTLLVAESLKALDVSELRGRFDSRIKEFAKITTRKGLADHLMTKLAEHPLLTQEQGSLGGKDDNQEDCMFELDL